MFGKKVITAGELIPRNDDKCRRACPKGREK